MKIIFLSFSFFMIGTSSFSQSSFYLQQIRRYAAKNRLDNFDSSAIYFNNRVKDSIHYLLPVYTAVLNESKVKTRQSAVSFYGSGSQYISFTGDYQSALQFEARGFEPLDSSIVLGIGAHVEESDGVLHTNARDYILNKAKNEQIIMINEAHNKPLHRAFTFSLLDDLFKQGFRYLAMEAFSNDSDQFFTKVDIRTGRYIAEPLGAELVRRALVLGYTLIPYEDTTRTVQHSGSQRDSSQAANIYKVLMKDPTAKILVHAGYGHISEEKIGEDYIPLAMAFKKLSGIDPLTIGQTEMTEGSGFEYGRIYYDQYIKKYPLQFASIAMLKNKPVSPLGDSGYDLTIIHPKTTYKNGRATWYSLYGLRKEIPIRPTEKELFMVQAYYETEYNEKNLGLLIPADQTYVAAENGYYYLYLQKGKYKLVYRDINYRVLSTKDLESN